MLDDEDSAEQLSAVADEKMVLIHTEPLASAAEESELDRGRQARSFVAQESEDDDEEDDEEGRGRTKPELGPPQLATPRGEAIPTLEPLLLLAVIPESETKTQMAAASETPKLNVSR